MTRSIDSLIPLKIRSIFPAPKFCPEKVAIVEPIISIGCVKNIDNFWAAAIAATFAEPKVLTALCKITAPTAVIEYCKAIGTAILISFLIIGKLIERA